jgi:hypothetical protein
MIFSADLESNTWTDNASEHSLLMLGSLALCGAGCCKVISEGCDVERLIYLEEMVM